MSKRKAYGDENYLAFVPVRNPAIEWSADEAGKVSVQIEWTGFYHRIAQKFFRRPRVSTIALDAYGSVVWQAIDGQKSVFDLSQTLQEAYPDLQNTMQRLIQFLEIMRDHHLIEWKEGA